MHNNINDIRVSLIARSSWSNQCEGLRLIPVVCVRSSAEFLSSNVGNTLKTWIIRFEKEIIALRRSWLFNERQWKRKLMHRLVTVATASKKKRRMMRQFKIINDSRVINGISDVIKFIKYKCINFLFFVWNVRYFICRIYINHQIYWFKEFGINFF